MTVLVGSQYRQLYRADGGRATIFIAEGFAEGTHATRGAGMGFVLDTRAPSKVRSRHSRCPQEEAPIAEISSLKRVLC